jgi:hypothetical protein
MGSTLPESIHLAKKKKKKGQDLAINLTKLDRFHTFDGLTHESN